MPTPFEQGGHFLLFSGRFAELPGRKCLRYIVQVSLHDRGNLRPGRISLWRNPPIVPGNDTVLNGPHKSLLRVSAHCPGVAESAQTAAGGRASGITPQHRDKLFTADVPAGIAPIRNAFLNGPFHALFIPRRAAAGIHAIKPGQNCRKLGTGQIAVRRKASGGNAVENLAGTDKTDSLACPMGAGVCKGFRVVHNFNCLAVAHGDTYTVTGNQGRFDNLLGAVGVDNNGYGGNGGIADGNFYPYRAGTPGGHGDRGC